MQIVTPLCRLREWQIGDAESLAFYANNPKIHQNLRDFFPYPHTIYDACNWIEFSLKQDEPQTLFAIEVDGLACGSIGLIKKEDIYRKNLELGYFLGEKYWGHGIITEAVKAICHYAFEQFDCNRIYAECFFPNIGSRRVPEKAGFTMEAILQKNVFKNGEFLDSCIFSLHKKVIYS
jgi:ribosomal-protein-alanine N-acetyltransferase